MHTHTHTHTQLLNTKSPSDRSVTLMHYIARVVRERFPKVLDFVNELTYLEKAGTGLRQ